jgi:hypothetical protein
MSNNNFRIESTPEESKGMHTNQGVAREDANIEAEKGETMVTSDGVSNQKKIVAIGGAKHGKGGTPLDVPDGTIIYSDKLKIKDPLILKFFNESGKKEKTFAQLSKKYDITKWQKELEDEDNDKITNDSLSKNLDDGNFKLSALFAMQEFHEEKGSPEEHSKQFEPFMERMGISYDQLFGTEGQGGEGQEPLLARDGGEVGFDNLPEMHKGGKTGHTHETDSSPEGNQPYESSVMNEKTPTGKSDFFSAYGEDLQTYAGKWMDKLGVDISKVSEKEAQSKIYDWSLKNNPEAIRNMWLSYGLTAQGEKDLALYKKTNDGVFERGTLTNQMLSDLKGAYVDGKFGVRQMDPNAIKIPKGATIERILPDAAGSDDPHKWDLDRGIDAKPRERNMDFRWDHKRALSQAIKNKTRIPRITPFTPIEDTTYADQIYYSPDQAIASMQSMVSNAGTKQAMFAPQQQQVSNSLAGQQFELMGKVIGQYEDKNVAAYNRESLTNTNIANRSAQRLAKSIEGHHDKTSTLQQEYSNARTNADNNIAENEIAMWNERRNRMNLEATIGEQFATDPNTGLHTFQVGKANKPTSNAQEDMAKTWSDLRRRIPEASESEITDMAMAMHSGKYEVRRGNNNPPNRDNYTN